MSEKFKAIKDQYSEKRGGKSNFFDIYCERCGNHLLLYQKDGPGPLKRMYLDRIRAPKELAVLKDSKNLKNLICKHCDKFIAIPLEFVKENRPAYALLAYVVIKKPGKGLYPPKIPKLLQQEK